MYWPMYNYIISIIILPNAQIAIVHTVRTSPTAQIALVHTVRTSLIRIIEIS